MGEPSETAYEHLLKQVEANKAKRKSESESNLNQNATLSAKRKKLVEESTTDGN